MSGSTWRSDSGTGGPRSRHLQRRSPVFLREHEHAEDAPDTAHAFVAVNVFGDA